MSAQENDMKKDDSSTSFLQNIQSLNGRCFHASSMVNSEHYVDYLWLSASCWYSFTMSISLDHPSSAEPLLWFVRPGNSANLCYRCVGEGSQEKTTTKWCILQKSELKSGSKRRNRNHAPIAPIPTAGAWTGSHVLWLRREIKLNCWSILHLFSLYIGILAHLFVYAVGLKCLTTNASTHRKLQGCVHWDQHGAAETSTSVWCWGL